MKKTNQILSLVLASFLLIMPFVSAYNYYFDNVAEQMTSAIDMILEVLSPFFEKIIGDYNTSDFFFSKILLLILLIVILKSVLDKTPIAENNTKISLIVSIIISILAIRFMNQNNFFEAIFIQYGTLGIAITTIIPMAIFFYVVHNLQIGTFGRKIFWTIYAVTLGAIWVSKSNEINPVANWIYGLTFLILIIFIFLDKSIHSYFGVSDFKKFVKDGNKKAIREAKKALDEIKEHFEHRRMNFTEFKRETKQLEDYIKELSKE